MAIAVIVCASFTHDHKPIILQAIMLLMRIVNHENKLIHEHALDMQSRCGCHSCTKTNGFLYFIYQGARRKAPCLPGKPPEVPVEVGGEDLDRL